MLKIFLSPGARLTPVLTSSVLVRVQPTHDVIRIRTATRPMLRIALHRLLKVGIHQVIMLGCGYRFWRGREAVHLHILPVERTRLGLSNGPRLVGNQRDPISGLSLMTAPCHANCQQQTEQEARGHRVTLVSDQPW